MKKISSLFFLAAAFTVSLDLTAQTALPQLSTSQTTVYYKLKNQRSNKYASYTSDRTQLAQTSTVDGSTLWYFTAEAGATSVADGVRIHNYSTANLLASHSSFTPQGEIWYIKPNPYNASAFCISRSSTLDKECWDDAQSQKIGYWTPQPNDFAGTSWTAEEVSAAELDNFIAPLKAEAQKLLEKNSRSPYLSKDKKAVAALQSALASNDFATLSKAFSAFKAAPLTAAPADGYYVLQNYLYDSYMTAHADNGLHTAPALEANSLFRLEKNDTTYTLKNVGTDGYVQAIAQSSQVYLWNAPRALSLIPADGTPFGGSLSFSGRYRKLHSSYERLVVGWESGEGSSWYFIPAGKAQLTAIIEKKLQEVSASGLSSDALTKAIATAQQRPTVESYTALCDAYRRLRLPTTAFDGYYRVVNKERPTAAARLTVDTDGSTVKSVDGIDDVAGIWELTPCGTAYFLHHPLSGKYIDAEGKAVEQGKARPVSLEQQTDGTYRMKAKEYLTINDKYTLVQYQPDENAAHWFLTRAESIEENLQTVGALSYTTLYYPFALTLPAGSQAYGVSTSGRLTPLDKTLPANVPALLVGKTPKVSLVIASTKAGATKATGTATADNDLIGTHTAIATPQEGALMFGIQNGTVGFHPYMEATIPAHRAYLPLFENPDGFALNLSVLTGLPNLDISRRPDAVFDLQGRSVRKTEKGLYIVNGKKVFIR